MCEMVQMPLYVETVFFTISVYFENAWNRKWKCVSSNTAGGGDSQADKLQFLKHKLNINMQTN
jgi:hypothetical protein